MQLVCRAPVWYGPRRFDDARMTMPPHHGSMTTQPDVEHRVAAYLRQRLVYHQEMADRYRRLTRLLFGDPAAAQPTRTDAECCHVDIADDP